MAQASLQNSEVPLRKGVSGCTVQLHPGQAHFNAVGLSMVVVMASPCSGQLNPLWSRRRCGGPACRTDKQAKRIY